MVEALLGHVDRVSRPERLRVASQCAPWADDLTASEAVPECEISQIPAAGQDGRLGGVPVVAVAEVGAVIQVQATLAIEVAREGRDNDDLVLGSS